MNQMVEIIQHVTAINRETEEGRDHAKQAIQKLCDQIGATEVQKKMVSDVLFCASTRPRITFSTARMMLGGVSRVTFWRWRRDDKYGLGSIDELPINRTTSETYLDQILKAMKRKAQ
jgi:hypothetical protein